ncbi:MAG: hypothetical protein K2X77_14640 [Candidatus Obscuribacterales bacterium]|jgi:hypothetical protein|nr:hypothetical protein [Candidatus Obscuribacterales bacterium]
MKSANAKLNINQLPTSGVGAMCPRTGRSDAMLWSKMFYEHGRRPIENLDSIDS